MFKTGKLKNNIRYILAPMHETQAVTVLVMVKVGSRNEPANLNGVSHFIEHLMFKGTIKRPTSFQISSELDGLGAEYNAFTSKQYTGYYIKINKDHLAEAMEMMADLAFNPLFDKAEMDRERGVIIEEIKMYEDNPLMYLGVVFEQLIFKGHALARKISGERQNIVKMKRDDLVKYHRDHYLTQNIILGVSGNFKEAWVKQLMQRHFIAAKSQARPIKPQPFISRQTTPRSTVLKKEIQQTQLALGWPAYKMGDPKVYPLTLLSIILGGGMSSRLFMEVREKRGLCYFIKASNDVLEDTGTFAIEMGLDTANIPEALKVIKAELLKIKAGKIKAEELTKAKEFLKGKMILQLEDSAQVISWLVEQQLLINKLENLPAKLKKINAVKLSDVVKVAKEIINFKKTNLALIGPFKDSQKYLDLLIK